MKDSYIGFIGVFIGAAISLFGTVYVTNVQLQEQNYREQIEKQHKNIEKMANILSYAPKVNLFMKAHENSVALVQSILQDCKNKILNDAQIDSCDTRYLNEELKGYNKEIFDQVAIYRTQRIIASLIFCEKTIKALNIEPFNGNWWELTNKQSGLLLDLMRSEVGCKNS